MRHDLAIYGTLFFNIFFDLKLNQIKVTFEINDKLFLGPTFLHDFVGGCDTNASPYGSPPISGRRRKSICFGHSICNFPTVWLHTFTHTFRACHRFHLSPLEIHM